MSLPSSRLPLAPLTDRERDILRLLAHGLSDREIAEHTVMTVGTVKWYNRQIYSKLGVRNRTEATIRAEHLGLLARARTPERTSSPPAARHNLPAPMTSFVGRKAELAQLRALFGQSRLITLTGPPGTGKTRLALEAAFTVLHAYRDGVYWIQLAPVSDPRHVLKSIAQHMADLKESSGQSLLESVQDWLRDKSVLLVLDNYEHLLSAAPLVSDLLKAGPNVTVLVTSREALRLYGEHEVPVQPLRVPDHDPQPAPDELQAFEAVDLFVQRARAVAPDFALNDNNAATVAAICVHLDGLPLAIELAAARIRFYAPQNLLVRLASRLEALDAGPRDLPARQQTLRATLAWSYDLLDEDEKLLFARLGVFANGCTYVAAQAVCGDNLSIDIAAGLESLLAKSLLRKDLSPTGETRVVMLETMREYALAQLEQRGERELVARRHAGYFMAFAERMRQELHDVDQARVLALFDAEHDNLRAALAWSLETGDSGEMSFRIIGGVAIFWDFRGYFSEGREWLAKALEKYPAIPPSKAYADALYGGADLAYNQSDYAATKDLFEKALAIYREMGDAQSTANTLMGLGNAATEVGDYDAALALFQEAYAIMRDSGGIVGSARALTMLGWCALRPGDYPAAREWLERALALFEQANDMNGISLALSGLGEVAIRQGDPRQAVPLLQRSLTIRRELGHPWGVAVSLGSLGWAALCEDDIEQASRLLGESLGIRLQIGDRGGIAWCLEKFAEIARQQGHDGQAVRLYGAAAAIRARVNSVIDPADQASHATRIRALQRKLPPDVYQAVWAEGQAMTLEQIRDNLLPPSDPQTG